MAKAVDIDRLYCLNSAFMRSTLQVSRRDFEDEILQYKFSEQRPHYAAELHKAEVIPTEPVVFYRDYGSVPRDLIGTGHGDTAVLLSQRVIDVLRREQVTGWTTYPSEIRYKRGKRVPGYHGFAITGRCPTPAEVSRGLSWWPKGPLDVPPYPEITRYAQLVEMGTWDGSDIFLVDDFSLTIVVERVKQVLEEARVTNIEFGRLVDLEMHRFGPPPGEDWPGADLSGSCLDGISLVKANLRGANLRDVDGGQLDLTAANLSQADLRGANLERAQLAAVDLTDARYDARTRWPAGFDPQAHGAQMVE